MGSLIPQTALTDDLFARFAQYLDASPRTVDTYARALKQFRLWLAMQGTGSPTRSDVLRYRDSLRQTRKPATTQLYMAAIRQFFRWTEQEGLYPDIAAHLKGAKISREHKKDALTPAQMQAVLKVLSGDDLMSRRDYALVSVAVTGGLRTVELVRADVGDLRNRGEHTVLYIQGKGQMEKADYVKLPLPVLEAINAYLAMRGRTRPENPLFASLSHRNGGERLTTRSVSRIVKTAFRRAGWDSDRLTAHSLRHTAATLNLLGGGSLEETQQLLRHSDINTTMVYLHHLERENNQSEERIAGAIFQKKG